MLAYHASPQSCGPELEDDIIDNLYDDDDWNDDEDEEEDSDDL